MQNLYLETLNKTQNLNLKKKAQKVEVNPLIVLSCVNDMLAPIVHYRIKSQKITLLGQIQQLKLIKTFKEAA